MSPETGLRVGEAVGLDWSDVFLQAAVHAKLGYIRVRNGKSKNGNNADNRPNQRI